MLSEDVRGIRASIATLAGKVSEQDWEFLQGIRANLESIADQTEELEKNATPCVEEVFV